MFGYRRRMRTCDSRRRIPERENGTGSANQGPDSPLVAFNRLGTPILLFAYGLAKFGDDRLGAEVLQKALASLREKKQKTGQPDPVHACLADAMEYRVSEMLQGRASQGPLPAQIAARINDLDANCVMVVNKIRQQLNILEPHEKSDPYLENNATGGIAINAKLAALRRIADPKALESEIRKILENNGTPLDKWSLQKALREMLYLSTRVGEPLARELLKQSLAALAPPNDQNAREWLGLRNRHSCAAG